MERQQGALEGKVAIVTGASRELGAAMAETLAAEGARVLVAHYDEAALAAAVVDRIVAGGRHAVAYDADCSSIAANQQLVAHAVALWGRLDIFVANAGITISKAFLETDEATWDRLHSLNLKGSFFGAQAAARQMIAQPKGGAGGRIVFSASVTGVRAVPNLAAYGITKAGLIHMARVLGLELGRYGITVNALGIGATLNARNLHDDPDYVAHWDSVVPVGRVGQPADVAAALLFLVRAEAGMVNGHTLMVDGGWTTYSPVA